jgi:hypothetical protein
VLIEQFRLCLMDPIFCVTCGSHVWRALYKCIWNFNGKFVRLIDIVFDVKFSPLLFIYIVVILS